MNIIIAAVGKCNRCPEAELVASYLKKTRWKVAVHELADAPASLPTDTRRAREAEGLRALLTPGTQLIALDGMGEQLTSLQFATLITNAQNHAVKRLLFALGGQDGLDRSILAQATRVVAFGKATWPHKMVRAMVAEQIYRAYSLSIGHPYHSGH